MPFEDWFTESDPDVDLYRLMWEYLEAIHAQEFMRHNINDDDLKAKVVRTFVQHCIRAGLLDG